MQFVQSLRFAVLVASLSMVHGHGRLIEPPSRSSMWRFGFSTPKNYNDNELFCGGFQRQWDVNQGKCGVCGDPWDGERQNEAGGKYATGVIARQYRQGETIQIEVDLTANHLGYYEFRLCPHNSPSTPVTQACLDKHLLRFPDGSRKYHVTTDRKGIYSMELVLPSDVTCTQCVIQWKYNTGNSWGCDETTGECCVGCGRQEQFYGCADVAITAGTELESTSIQTTGKSSQSTATPATSSTATTATTSTQGPRTTVKTPQSTATPATSSTATTATKSTQGPHTTVKTPQSTVTSEAMSTTTTTTSQPITTSVTSQQVSITPSQPIAESSTMSSKIPTTASTTTSQPIVTSTQSSDGMSGKCQPIGLWTGNPRVGVWCIANCRLGFCPDDICSESCRLLAPVEYYD